MNLENQKELTEMSQSLMPMFAAINTGKRITDGHLLSLNHQVQNVKFDSQPRSNLTVTEHVKVQLMKIVPTKKGRKTK